MLPSGLIRVKLERGPEIAARIHAGSRLSRVSFNGCQSGQTDGLCEWIVVNSLEKGLSITFSEKKRKGEIQKKHTHTAHA